VQLSRDIRFHVFASVALAVIFAGLVYASPNQLGAWSKPISVAEGSRYHGYQSTVVGDIIVVAMVDGNTGIETWELTAANNKSSSTFRSNVSNLLHYVLVSSGNNYCLVWAEKTSGNSVLYAQAPSHKKTILKEVPGLVSGLSASFDNLGRLVLVWVDNTTGMRAIFAQEFNAAFAPMGEAFQISPTGLPVSEHAFIVSGNNLHIFYKATDQVFTDILHQMYGRDELAPTSPLRIRRAVSDSLELPAFRAIDDGAAEVYWVQDAQQRGTGGATIMMRGQIGPSGNWSDAPGEIMRFSGRTASLSMAHEPSNDTFLAFVNNQSGSFQVYSVDNTFCAVQATYGSNHRFSSKAHVLGGNRIVLYQEMSKSHSTLWLTSFVPGARLPLAARLGLSPNAPLLDLSFRVITLVAGSLVLSIVASLAVLTAVGLVTLVSRMLRHNSCWPVAGMHLAMYMLLAIIKFYGGALYYGAVRVPGTSGVLIAIGSAAFAWGAVKIVKLERNDMLALGISGLLWVWADAFCSVFVRGGGLW